MPETGILVGGSDKVRTWVGSALTLKQLFFREVRENEGGVVCRAEGGQGR